MSRLIAIRPLAALLIAVLLLDLAAFALHSEEGHDHCEPCEPCEGQEQGEPCAICWVIAEPASIETAPASAAAPEPVVADVPPTPAARLEAVDLHPWNARSPPATPAV